MSKLNVLIAGATGYIGIQLTKLLLDHSNIKIKYLCGNTSKGKSIKYFDKSINAKNLPKITKFNYTNLKDVKIKFTSLPRVAPLIIPLLLTAKTISGSGLFQFEIGFRPTSEP